MNNNIAHNISQTNRTADVFNVGGKAYDFDSFLLSEKVLAGLKHCGFVQPSPIQVQAIPLAKCGLDLVCQAKSGTGKTCVLAVCTLETIDTSLDVVQALILAPTREIAHQIHGVVTSIGCFIDKLRCSLFIGGLPINQDIEALKKCHVAVATPGRVKFLIEKGYFSTKSIRLFILDEADKLLEHGSFEEQINWIFSTLPKDKQMLALSATYPELLATHLNDYMRDPIHVRINPQDVALKGVVQFYKTVKHHALPNKLFDAKYKILVEILQKIPFQQCMVFSNLHSRAEHLSRKLIDQGWPSTFIAGTQVQKDRLKAIDKLKKFHCRILITTDLTSRGIDCDKVNLVINLDLPWDNETYLHRIGRAGRFGSHGIAISLVSEKEEKKQLLEMTKALSKQPRQLPQPEQLSTLWDNLSFFDQNDANTENIDSTTKDSLELNEETLSSKGDSSKESNVNEENNDLEKYYSSTNFDPVEINEGISTSNKHVSNENSLPHDDEQSLQIFDDSLAKSLENKLQLNPTVKELGVRDVLNDNLSNETEHNLDSEVSLNTPETLIGYKTENVEVGFNIQLKEQETFKNTFQNPLVGEKELASKNNIGDLKISGTSNKDSCLVSSNVLKDLELPTHFHHKKHGTPKNNGKTKLDGTASKVGVKKPIRTQRKKTSASEKNENTTANEVSNPEKCYEDYDENFNVHDSIEPRGSDSKYHGDKFESAVPQRGCGDNALHTMHYRDLINESIKRYQSRFLNSRYGVDERGGFNQKVFMDSFYRAYNEHLDYWRQNNQFYTSYPTYYSYYRAQNIWQDR